MKRLIAAIFAICAGIGIINADIPQGYYDNLNGKSGAELKAAVKALKEAGFDRQTYNTKTWPAFEQTDVRIVGGREVWWDMYSNNIVYLPAHDALNIEHCVANSWWGGKSGNGDAYADLFHLNPSDQNANNKKSAYPPATVVDATLLDNDMLKVGLPAAGQGGGAKNAFEPADEYKGDFARAFFYIFTTYADAPWQDDSAYVYGDDKQMQQWAVDLLLSWHRADPVDSKEKNRNEAIYGIQKNRNAYIDHPELIEYIWGDNQGQAWQNGEAATAINRPEAPVFEGARITAVNTYVYRWWDGFNQVIQHGEGTLMLSIDGRDYFESTGETYIDPAFSDTETHTYRAYVVKNVDGHELRSSIAKLTVQALNPDVTDYSQARWTRVTDTADIEDDQYYIILSTNTLHAMSTDGGVTGKTFMESAGFVEFDNEDRVIEVPVNTAIVRFEAAGDGKHRLMVDDTRNNYLGSWKATAKNAMNLKKDTYTPGEANIKGDGTFEFKFDEFGTLQFNKTQPRFLNYESNQSPVYLYKFLDFEHSDSSNIESIAPQLPWAVGVDGHNIIVEDGTLIFDLSGRSVSGRNLAPGTYIVVGAGKSLKIRI